MAKVVSLHRDPSALDLVAEPMSPIDVMALAIAHAERGGHGAMATVIERHGSAPSTPGQKIWVSSDRRCAGTIGGGAIERDVMIALDDMARDRSAKHAVRELKLGPELGMCCGGRVVVLLEPIASRVPCLVVGGGHVASILAPMLVQLGFAVTLVDARDAWGREGRLEGVRCVVGDYDDVGKTIDPSGIFLTMTHDHALDQDAIEWALRRGFAFVGGVGSRAKAQRTRDRLAAKGFSEADIARVQMPLGVPIGARLPEELAVSIAGALIAWRRGPTPPAVPPTRG
jgi:xanthine dehydrogenase accessory factor